MNRHLTALIANRPIRPEAVRQLCEAHGEPLVDGDHVTFLFLGRADSVHLRHWIWGLDGRVPFTRIEQSDLWYCELELPPCSRVEYKLEVAQGPHEAWILDPLNPRRASDPFGANSVCHASEYRTPDWTQHDPEARQGALDGMEIDSAAFGDRRRLGLYLPARFRRERRYPLLVIHDGDDFLRYADLRVVLDNLIHRLEVAPLVVALTNPGDRLREYADDPRHASHLVDEVLPALEQRFPLRPALLSRGLMGASFGAVAALSTAWRRPEAFGRLLLLSGSFAFSDIGRSRRGPEFDPVVRMVNEFRRAPSLAADRVFVACGLHESLIYENRSMLPVLSRAGPEILSVESRDGHNWENWRDRLRQGLSWLFPGSLWMTYE